MRSVIALVGAAVALAVGSPSSSATTRSGIRGIVVKGPTRPVCQEGVPCSAPAAGIALVFTRGGAVIGRAGTARDGSFRAVLPPGTYVVRAVRPSPIGGMRPRMVVVRQGMFTVVKLAIDTGIR